MSRVVGGLRFCWFYYVVSHYIAFILCMSGGGCAKVTIMGHTDIVSFKLASQDWIIFPHSHLKKIFGENLTGILEIIGGKTVQKTGAQCPFVNLVLFLEAPHKIVSIVHEENAHRHPVNFLNTDGPLKCRFLAQAVSEMYNQGSHGVFTVSDITKEKRDFNEQQLALLGGKPRFKVLATNLRPRVPPFVGAEDEEAEIDPASSTRSPELQSSARPGQSSKHKRHRKDQQDAPSFVSNAIVPSNISFEQALVHVQRHLPPSMRGDDEFVEYATRRARRVNQTTEGFYAWVDQEREIIRKQTKYEHTNARKQTAFEHKNARKQTAFENYQACKLELHEIKKTKAMMKES